MNVLYISYDGITDPLGESQILPYLTRLSSTHAITLISFEKKKERTRLSEMHSYLSDFNISWHPLRYTKSPPILSTIYDLLSMSRLISKLHKTRSFRVVHCRSYISAILGLKLQQKYGVKFLFDMRDFWPDERVEGNIWNLKNPVFKIVYSYFKRKELTFWKEAKHVICLTDHAKGKITRLGIPESKISVIPTCVDQDFFKNPGDSSDVRKELGIIDNDFILSYVGSIGSWYRTYEILVLFKFLLVKRPEAKLLIISKSSNQEFEEQRKQLGISARKVIYTKGNRDKMPKLISLSTWSIFFYSPSPAKAGTSPTKMAELVTQQIPIVANSGIGDLDLFFEKYQLGQLIPDITDEKALEDTATFIAHNPSFKSDDQLVKDHFDVERAHQKIKLIYERIRQ